MIGVNTIVFDKIRKRILLVKRRDIPVWVLPGGGVERGESPKKAAIRETFEESGLLIKDPKLVGVFTKLKSSSSHKTLVYLAQQTSGKPQTGNESSEVAFWRIASLPPTLPWYLKARITTIMDSLPERDKPVRIIQPISTTSLLWQYIRFPAIFPSLLLFALKKQWRF